MSAVEAAVTPGTAARRVLVAGAGGVAVATPLVLGAARWPRWWLEIAPEQTAMTWLQSVVLVLVAAGCALAAAARTGMGRGWLLLGAGFAALAVDERFAVHERVRDQLLAPADVTVPFLPWVAPGDFLMLAYAVAGLLVLPRVARCFRDDRGARIALLTGIACALVAVGTDSIDPATWTLAQERVQQSLEECFELAADLCFAVAVGLQLLSLMSRLPSRA
ncbi:hypothetical protein [Symbioplanes lichenis]|uniref:hypothetical protein n=1 Tax=Symbioplanes lichenis TaxID=1629072 RepID=UPI002738EFF7|nr:hypothetical protein [Actinoplanes lichenis]